MRSAKLSFLRHGPAEFVDIPDVPSVVFRMAVSGTGPPDCANKEDGDFDMICETPSAEKIKCQRCQEQNEVRDSEPYFVCKACGKKCTNTAFVPLDLGCDLE